MSKEEQVIEILKEAKDRLIKPKMLKDVRYTNEDYSKAIEMALDQIKSLKAENDFLRFMYKGTEEYKAIERYASGDHIPRID